MPEYNERLSADIGNCMMETMQGLFDCGLATQEDLNEMKRLQAEAEHEAYLRMMAKQSTYISQAPSMSY